jgi:phospholipase A1/A2
MQYKAGAVLLNDIGNMKKVLTIYVLCLMAAPVMAMDVETATPVAPPVECKNLTDREKRLQCYDSQSLVEAESLTGTVLDDRIRLQYALEENSYSLDAHYPSYILPFSYMSSPNESPYSPSYGSTPLNEDLKNMEVKFQISFRLPLNRDFFVRGSHLWFAYTQLSLWQLYNRDGSSPYRESNYEPELVWAFLVNKSIGDAKLTHVAIALNHQSNGQPEPLSRSWNRVYINGILAYNNWVFNLRPWYRLPENQSDDDNPDIEDYMGNFDIRVGYKQHDHQFSSLFRSTFDQDNPRSYYELGYSFSIHRKYRGYVQFVNGYGESLIDYNHRNKRVSLGIMLNDWF